MTAAEWWGLMTCVHRVTASLLKLRTDLLFATTRLTFFVGLLGVNGALGVDSVRQFERDSNFQLFLVLQQNAKTLGVPEKL